jgi:two-component system phosphate regulon sensor histidine kinase PhoR
MINHNLFLTLIICFLLVCLSMVLVSLSGLVYLSFIPIVLAFVFTLIISTRIDTSIKNLADITLKASRGDFNGRYTAKTDWEIEPLGIAINDLLENLTLLTKEYKYDREELKLILKSISEALWIQNQDGQIIWSSIGFNDLFPNYTRGSNQYYWEVVRDPVLLDLIKAVETNRELQLREIILGDHYYLFKSNFNPKTETTVFIMQNIDLLRQTEQMKKDFIINLAHELRTPLTAIKGFSEALHESADQNNIRYLNIIRNHTDRLINLVSDLQTLSQLERLPELNLQEINLLTFFENIRALYLQNLQERGLTFEIEADADIPRLEVDPFKFEQIFINLIDNALRYTSEGGIVIRIRQHLQSLLIEICDTGIGIAEEHLPRIFERFYVADPSRNRSQSGTGLGLAIAKHSVLLHGGTIEVQSIPGKGACFIMNFPLPQ